MGYTHYFYTEKEMNKERFALLVADCKRILDYCNDKLGIAIADGMGENHYIADLDSICFNGSVKQPIGKWTTDEQVSIPWPSPEASLTEEVSDPIGKKTAGEWFAGTIVSQRVAPINNETGYGSGDYETLYIERRKEIEKGEEFRMKTGLYFDFCKTAYRPYDLPVTAVLIALKHHFPKSVIRSDGEEKDWLDGKILCNNLLGYGMEFKLNEEG